MPKTEGNFLKIYRLAYEDKKALYRSLILLGLIFSFFLLAQYYSFFVVSQGLIKRINVILALLFWFLSLVLFVFFAIASNSKMILLALVVLPLTLFLTLFLVKFPFETTPIRDLIIYYLILFFSFLFAVLFFNLEVSGEIKLSFYRIIKRGSLFLTLIVFTIFWLFFSWQYSLNFNNLLNVIIDEIPLPFNTTVNEFIENSVNNQGLFYSPEELPNVIPPTSLEEKIQRISQEFSQQTEVPEIASTEINLQSEASQQMMEAAKKQLETIFGQPLTGEENLSILIKNFLKTKITQSFSLPFFKWIYWLVLILIAFSLISLVNFFLSIFLSILSRLILPLLIRVKLLKIDKKGIEKEILTVKV